MIGRYGLTSDSFRLHGSDPLGPIASLPARAKHSLTGGNHCLLWHRFRGVGGSAFHIRGRDGAVVGGFALPLERYPEMVWKRFVFEQAQVAEEVGATAVDFAPGVARALYDSVVLERTSKGVEAWTRPDRDRVVERRRAEP